MKEEINTLVGQVFEVMYTHFQTKLTELVRTTVQEAMAGMSAVKLFDETLLDKMHETAKDAAQEIVDNHSLRDDHPDEEFIANVTRNVMGEHDFTHEISDAIDEYDFDTKIKDYIQSNVSIVAD